jgi:3-dehydroquinate dehydratase
VLVGVLHGPNFNVLERRDPALYGGLSLHQLEDRIRGWGTELGCDVVCRQTNHEGEYVEWCQELGEAAAGARIVIVNHFQSTNRFIALFEKWLCPLCTKLGRLARLGWRRFLEHPLHVVRQCGPSAC